MIAVADVRWQASTNFATGKKYFTIVMMVLIIVRIFSLKLLIA